MKSLISTILITGATAANLPMFVFDQVFVLDKYDNPSFSPYDFNLLQEKFEAESKTTAEEYTAEKNDAGFTSLNVQIPIFIILSLILIVLVVLYKKCYKTASEPLKATASVATISEMVSTTNSTENIYNQIPEDTVARVFDNNGYKNSAENLSVYNTADYVVDFKETLSVYNTADYIVKPAAEPIYSNKTGAAKPRDDKDTADYVDMAAPRKSYSTMV